MGSSFFMRLDYSEFKVNIKIYWKISLKLEKFHIFELLKAFVNTKLCKDMKFRRLKVGNFPKSIKRNFLAYFTKLNKRTHMKKIGRASCRERVKITVVAI